MIESKRAWEENERLEDLKVKISDKLSCSPRYKSHGYVMLAEIFDRVLKSLKKNGYVNSKNSFVMPGGLWIAKRVMDGKMSIDDAAEYLNGVYYFAQYLFRMFVNEKELTIIVPDEDVKEIRVNVWIDKDGLRDGKPAYILTMLFAFPYDISSNMKESEYEPVSVLFIMDDKTFIPLEAYTRVHYDLYKYTIMNAEKLKILFTRLGHTPKILNIKPEPQNPNKIKKYLDKTWLIIGDALTRMTGVKEINLKNFEKYRIKVTPVLPLTVKNPFITQLYPYFRRDYLLTAPRPT
jgi:hypothetical protein